MDKDAQLEIARYLDPGESLLWSGRPRQGMLLRQSDILIIPFSIVWSTGVAVGMAAVFLTGASPIFGLFGAPFVVVALHILFGRFLLDAQQRKAMFYGFTEYRVIIVSGILWRSIKSLPLPTLNHISLDERPDRSGTITFGPTHAWMPFQYGASATRGLFPAFELIAEARSVCDRLREAQKRAA